MFVCEHARLPKNLRVAHWEYLCTSSILRPPPPKPTLTPHTQPSQDSDNYTALHMAVSHGAPVEFIQFLLDKGADPNAKAKEGYVALHFMRTLEDEAVVTALIKAGANVNMRGIGNLGFAPLHIAVHRNAPLSIVKLLLELGKADPNVKVVIPEDKVKLLGQLPTGSGFTPLIFAAKNCSTKIELAQLLMHHHANAAQKDDHGCTAASLCLKSDVDVEVQRLLIRDYSARHCFFCSAYASGDKRFTVCSRCNFRAYCSPECQKKDWKDHKLKCTPTLSFGDLSVLFEEIKSKVVAKEARDAKAAQKLIGQ